MAAAELIANEEGENRGPVVLGTERREDEGPEMLRAPKSIWQRFEDGEITPNRSHLEIFFARFDGVLAAAARPIDFIAVDRELRVFVDYMYNVGFSEEVILPRLARAFARFGQGNLWDNLLFVMIESGCNEAQIMETFTYLDNPNFGPVLTRALASFAGNLEAGGFHFMRFYTLVVLANRLRIDLTEVRGILAIALDRRFGRQGLWSNFVCLMSAEGVSDARILRMIAVLDGADPTEKIKAAAFAYLDESAEHEELPFDIKLFFRMASLCGGLREDSVKKRLAKVAGGKAKVKGLWPSVVSLMSDSSDEEIFESISSIDSADTKARVREILLGYIQHEENFGQNLDFKLFKKLLSMALSAGFRKYEVRGMLGDAFRERMDDGRIREVILRISRGCGILAEERDEVLALIFDGGASQRMREFRSGDGQPRRSKVGRTRRTEVSWFAGAEDAASLLTDRMRVDLRRWAKGAELGR